MTAPTDVTFSAGTKITSQWLNGVNDHVNNLEADPHPSYLSKTEAATTYTTQADLASSAAGKGDELVATKQIGVGAVDRNQHQLNLEIVRVSDYGDVTTSDASANAAWNAACAAIGNVGCLINPKGSLVDFSAVSIPNAVMVIDMQGQRIIESCVGVGKSVGAGGTHLLIRDARLNQATRVHQEPNGYPVGVATKYDLMFDPYDIDTVNYRIVNLYTKTYDPTDASTTAGNNGVAVLGLKGVGRHWGVWPSLHFGFSDDGSGSAVPMKMYYFDTSDTAWRTPMKGAWRADIAVNSGDYMLSANKLYQSGTTGTTGATAPSHTSGSVSDGSVNWTFIRDFSVAGGALAIKGCVVFGDRDDLPKFGLPSVRAQFAGQAAFWNGVPVNFLTNTGGVSWKAQVRLNTSDLYIENSDGSKFLRFGTNFVQSVGLAELLSSKSITDNSATPDVTGTQIVIFNNSSPTSITAMTGSPNQRLIIKAANGNTTLVNSASIQTNTNANKVLTVKSCLEFIFNAAGTACTEIGTL